VTVKKLNVSSGIRINSFLVRVNDAVFGDQKLSPTAVVGNFGVRYSMSETVSPFISFQSAFRAPNIDDMSKFGPVEANVFEIPSGELSPERSVQSEVGLKLNHRNINGSVAVYHTRLSNLIDRAPAMYLESPTYEGRTVYQKENIGSAVLKGIEGEVEFSISRGVRMLGNMTYTYGQNINKGEPLRRVPPLFARAGVILNQKKWWTSYTISLAGKQTRLAPGDRSDVRISSRLKEGVMPGWKSINVSAGVDYPAWSVALNIVNVFDESYRIYGSGVDEYGRSLTLSLRIRI
jgi:outer membrane receptor protein involved in Fe transport